MIFINGEGRDFVNDNADAPLRMGKARKTRAAI
jgi:hypothetical protein